VDGYTSGNPGVNNVEVALDIEMSVSMAPGLAGVIVYEGPNMDNITAPNDILNCMATNDAAQQLSCSWGFGINSSTVQIFQQFGTQGQSFFLASGDNGAFTGAAPRPRMTPISQWSEERLCPPAARAVRGCRKRCGAGSTPTAAPTPARRHQHHLHHSFLAGACQHGS
jgi:hypothetical protein